MSFQITTAFVQQFRANIEHVSQQKGSRLRKAVRMESVTGKLAYFEQLGTVGARKRTNRHSDTPQMDTPHLRRRVSMIDFDWADLIDQEDKVRMLIDPASDYSQTAAWAMGREIDKELVAAAIGTAWTGEDGSTSVAFDSTMIVPDTVTDLGVTAADSGLNTGKVLAAKRLLDEREVDTDGRVLVVTARQLENLLNTTKATSADFNTIRALVMGEINTWLGFEFIRVEFLPDGSDASHVACLFWQKRGMLLAMGREASARITERADKNYATQVFYSQTIGATRMHENHVGYIDCHKTLGPNG
jgi:hypothetical protein